MLIQNDEPIRDLNCRMVTQGIKGQPTVDTLSYFSLFLFTTDCLNQASDQPKHGSKRGLPVICLDIPSRPKRTQTS